MKHIRKIFGFIIFVISVILTGCTTSVSFTINFDSNGGTDVAAIVTDGNSTITIPEDPTREGFFFGGWYWDNTTFSQPFTANSLLDSPLSSNMTVYAKWNKDNDYIPPESFQITFDSNGGTEIDPVHILEGHTIAIPVVTKDGYTLDGWYTSVNGGTTLDERWSFTTSKVTNDLTLYAKWNIDTYTIIYHLNDGTNSVNNQSTYTFETETLILEDPTKEGYTFIGWYLQEDFSGEIITQVPLHSYGNKVLYAKWEINQYDVCYYYMPEDYDPMTNFSLIPGETITHIAAGGSHSLAITSANRMLAWGYNNYGQLGNGTTINKSTPMNITSRFGMSNGETITQIAAGGFHSLAITSTGRVFTWGYNNYGQLGDGTTINKVTPINITSSFGLVTGESVTQIVAGYFYSFAITSSGRVFAWGYNNYGELGDGTVGFKSTPTEITGFFGLSYGETVTQIVGGSHSLAITSNGRVFAWGGNWYGQLGDGTDTGKLTPTEITSRFNLFSSESVIQIVVGYYNSLAITSNGRVFVWGDNRYGQIGDGTAISAYTPRDITSRFSFSTNETVKQIVAGDYFSLVLTSTGRVFAWGYNRYGQLGDGTTIDRSTPLNISSNFVLSTDEYIERMIVGDFHTFVITSANRMLAWGYNNYGQLGDGTTINKLTPTNVTFILPVLYKSEIYDFGTTILEPVVTRPGYTFSGWYTDDSLSQLYVFTNMPAQNLTLFGKWTLKD